MYSGRIDRIGFILGIGYLIFPIVEAILAYVLLSLLIGRSPAAQHLLDVLVLTVGCPFVMLWGIVAVPTLVSLSIRRWHDLGLSGWLSLLLLVPFIGIITTFMLLLTEGTDRPGKHGPSISPRRIFAVLFGE